MESRWQRVDRSTEQLSTEIWKGQREFEGPGSKLSGPHRGKSVTKMRVILNNGCASAWRSVALVDTVV